MIRKNREKPATRAIFTIVTVLSATIASKSQADAAPTLVPELKFSDFYRMPIGPRGLEVSQRLLSLNGHTVQMRGYMVRQELPVPGLLILSPVPVELGDADESLSDDLPPTVVFVHFDDRSVPHSRGVLQLTGTLSVGARNEADGHVSQVQLNVDPDQLPVNQPADQP